MVTVYLDVEPSEYPIKVLGIAGSPRKGNTEILVKEALEGASEIGAVTTRFYSFHRKRFEGCAATCTTYCMRHGRCVIDDDFNDFMDVWLDADGIIFGAPVYAMGPPAQVKAALDRLGNVLICYFAEKHPRFSKVCATICQGASRWGGQEIAIQFFVEQFLALSCLPIAGDLPESYLGVAGYAGSASDRQGIRQDKVAVTASRNIGRRVAEMSRIVKLGMAVLGDWLPDEYRFTREAIPTGQALPE
ncbi:MAG: flavodoxin family protein [Anaerolineae bacterium]